MDLDGKRILITGPTSQVAFPLARELASRNEVFGLARFSQPEALARVESIGVAPIRADLADDALDEIPEDLDYVLHFAVVKSGDFEYDLRANAEGVGRLMARCRKAKAFLHVSSGGVYEHAGAHLLREEDPLGDNHRAMMPTYSICKIAAETVVRFAARQWNIPTTIARFSVPYGNNGGWPWVHLQMMKNGVPIRVHPDRPNLFNPIHEDDYIEHVPKLLEIADVPARVINWGGAQVSLEEWTAYIGELTGLVPKYEETTETIGSVTLDLERMHASVGVARVDWRDGIRRMLETFEPDLLRDGRAR